MQWQWQQHALIRSNEIRGAEPQRIRDQVAMRQRHSLRISGRAGGVEQRGGPVRARSKGALARCRPPEEPPPRAPRARRSTMCVSFDAQPELHAMRGGRDDQVRGRVIENPA